LQIVFVVVLINRDITIEMVLLIKL
jgi:hypothetical protein